MVTDSHSDLRVTQEAARWLMELQTEGAACHAEFARWLKRSPEHVEEFLGIAGLSSQLEGIDPERRIDVEALLRNEGAEIVRLPGASSARRPTPLSGRRGWPAGSRWLAGAALAASVVAGVLFLWQPFAPASETYATRLGEQRVFKLAEGSIIQLNTRSRVRVQLSSTAREVQLLEGEALFTIERDPQRPFAVRTDTTTVQVLGTQFNVYRSGTGVTTVSVIEGKVAVAPSGSAGARTELIDGEQATVSAGRIEAARLPDMGRVTAWRERKLVFQDKPLAEVVAEFNRYNALQLAVEGNVGTERFSGVFAADRPESLMSFLEKDASLRIERVGDRVVIRGR